MDARMSRSRSINSAILIRIFPRSNPGVFNPQVVSKALRAALMAISTSASTPSGMEVRTSPVVGLTTLVSVQRPLHPETIRQVHPETRRVGIA